MISIRPLLMVFVQLTGPSENSNRPSPQPNRAKSASMPESVAVEAFTGLPFSMEITPGAGVKSLMILSVPVEPLPPMIWSSSPRFKKLNLPDRSTFADMP